MKLLLVILIAVSTAPARVEVGAGHDGAGTVAGIAAAGRAGHSQDFWEGTYEFAEDGGKTAGGTPILVFHTLMIRREGDSLVAEIESNGYQTARHLFGEVKLRPGAALIYFQSYGETNLFKPYSEGELLLTLKRSSRRGRRALVLTEWGAFQPAVRELASGRVHFTKKL
jgi:hypothetical protein